jgi:arylformamidase
MKIEYRRIYDISLTLGKDSVDYPGDTPFSCEQTASIEDENYNLSKITMSAHSGTHLDAPLHFIRQGRPIDFFSPESFILPARVMDIPGVKTIRPEALEGMVFEPGHALIFKTDNSKNHIYESRAFTDEFVSLALETAVLCADKKIPLVGFDYITVEPSDSRDFSVHQTLLQNNVLILEGLTLSHVPPGEYTLICLPLKISQSEASPVRAVLLGS